MYFSDKSKHKFPDRYLENVQGDFYVEDGVCTSCGAPQAEAPDLIDHSKSYYGHCYFKKQPQTDEEIERVINAIAVSCTSGLRYGGTDEKILKRLYEIGEQDQCDHKPIGHYKTIIWNRVTFLYAGSIKKLAKLITTQIVLRHTHLNKRVINFKADKQHSFEFIYRWADGHTGTIFKCYYIGDNKFCVEINIEENGYAISLRGNAMDFNSILCSNQKISAILWLDKDNNTYNETELR
jgi:hypothetical protein